MQQYERDTWYDLWGRIVFSNSKGLVGVGLPRKGGTAQPQARLTLPDGTVREGPFGWEDVQGLPGCLRLSPIIPKRCKKHSLTPHKRGGSYSKEWRVCSV